MMRLDDPDLVRRQYATEDGLAVRRDSQRRYLEGTNAFDVAFAAVERVHRYVESTVFASVVPRPLPAVGGALRSRTRTTVFVAQR